MSFKAGLLALLFCFSAVTAERGFIMTSPRNLAQNSENLLHLHLFDVFSEGNVELKLLKTDNDSHVYAEGSYTIPAGVSEYTLPFQVPEVADYEAKLQIKGSFDTDDKYQIFGEDNINFLYNYDPQMIFVQTDKPIYKPGQTVKFRVLVTNRKLKPLGKGTEGDIWVENPANNRIMQWKNVSLGNGIRQLEFPLSEEPDLGFYTIFANVNSQKYETKVEVKEYVLPKYEITIEPPSFVLITAENMTIKICGKYTYGKLVEGKITINTTLETYSWSHEKYPSVLHEGELEGCMDYDFNISLIDPELLNTYRRIKLFAEIEEKGTGVIRNKTIYIDRTQTPLNIRFQSGPQQYFKPGLPFKGQLKVSNPDNTVAPDEPIRICVSISRERTLGEWWATRKVKFCRNYTSDASGVVYYTIPPQNTDVISISLEAVAMKYTNKHDGSRPSLYQPQTHSYLRPWYSPSGSHIQIQGLESELECGKEGTAQVLFTSKESKKIKFITEVVYKGNVIEDGVSEVDFDVKDSIPQNCEHDITLDADEIQLVPPPMQNRNAEETAKEVKDDNENCKAMQKASYVPHVGSFNVTFPVSAQISPAFYLIVYYVNDDRETVADSHQFTVQKCFNNKVTLEFSENSVQPGTKATMTLTSSPNSLCGIKVVDKSISLLDSSNQLTKDEVFNQLRSNDGGYYSKNHCNDQKPQPGLPRPLPSTGSEGMYYSTYPKPWSSSSYEDAITAFENAGFMVISDLKLITRPCKSSGGSGAGGYESYGGVALPSMGVRGGAYASRRPAPPSTTASLAFDSAPAPESHKRQDRPVSITKSAVDVRTYFPETWLFQFQIVGEDGTVSLKEQLPHTITEWLGSAVCINEEQGLGLSETASIKGFQAFFLSFTLPYSVVRGEKVPVVATIFNYIDKCLSISMEFRETGGFTLLDESVKRTLCICGGKSESTEFVIQPTTLGKLNLTVAAQNAEDSNICGDDFEVADVVAKDAITNELLVEAEGFPNSKVTSMLFCPKDSENEVFKYDASFAEPEDLVEDSERAYISFSGDIMGATIQNLDRLVRLPTGCGEQNIVTFTPNVLVLDYLSSTGKLTDKIKTKAIGHLQKGYQRELKYLRPDGSFSAFGAVDRNGSTFLTAFVMKSFAQAKKYIDIDQTVMDKSKEWLISTQRDDGCFAEVGQTLSQGMKGGLNGSMSSMTAYVTGVLLLSGDSQDAEHIKKAFTCIEKEETLSSFSAALIAYTEALAGRKEQSQRYLDILFTKAETADGETHWYKKGSTSQSEAVETAAYAVLTLLLLDESTEKSLPIVRSLVKMRNDYGGFYSTQDTVLGLEALSKFSSKLSKDPVDISVKLSGGMESELSFNEDDKLLVKKVKVPTLPTDVNVEATGSGCGIMQTILLFNTKNPVKQQYFALNVEAKRVEGNCDKTTIKVCTRYTPENKKSNMALVEVKMASGMVASQDSLKTLEGDRDLELKRTEVNNNNVVFYFDELTNDEKCFEFTAEEITKIGDRKPATAKVYDYYAPEHSEDVTYTIPESC